MVRTNLQTFCYYLRVSIVLSVLLLILPFLHGCASHKNYKPHPELIGRKETGIASYYAMKFQFNKTASGELLNNFSMTAAHKTLPFGTQVIVKNLKNGKSVKVTINDRGPFIKGRIIDLTRAAFSQIESMDKGITKVQIRVVGSSSQPTG